MSINLTSMIVKVGHNYKCDVIVIMYMDQRLSQELTNIHNNNITQVATYESYNWHVTHLFVCFVTN